MPAMIVTVAQQKGGAGKTTIAVQLATCWRSDGRSVAVVDIDPQASLTGWMRLREHRARGVPELQLSMVGGWRLGVELDRLRSHHDVIVIDSPPHAETEAREAIRGADLVIIPCQPSPLDVWASRSTIEMAKREGRRHALLLNRVPARGRVIEDTASAIAREGFAALSARLGNRQAFVNSLARGLGVIESEPKSAAAGEVRGLVAEVGSALTS